MKETKPIIDRTKEKRVIDLDYTDIPWGHQPRRISAGKHGKRKKPREKRVKDESE